MHKRSNWQMAELEELYSSPLILLISRAHQTHLQFHSLLKMQLCHLISVKTGGCPEDCSYCAQSSRYKTSVTAQPMMPLEEVLLQAKKAIAKGATRICLGAAWRQIKDGKPFEDILKMIKEITGLGVEVCCTLGMLNRSQAKRLKEAGLYAYNHNLDTSKSFYSSIVTTRNYQDRLNTLEIVADEGLSLCCGGILGLGESVSDRLELLLTLSKRHPQPDSVPINLLSRVIGTPLENQPLVPFWELLRFLAITRIVLPKSMIRFACGRNEISFSEQTLCFLVGVNSLFIGDKLLTVPNQTVDKDEELFKILGVTK